MEYVTTGSPGPMVLVGIIGIGLTLPLFLSFVEMLFEKLIKPYADWVSGVKFASILSGGIILRFVIVWGGGTEGSTNCFTPAKSNSSWRIKLMLIVFGKVLLDSSNCVQ